ncbi:DUF2797 domain-containing protein [Psychromicrobium xiongbiense]|uniref:DUF2797 domain-containing protein n=1 Tax=Psychromicrobium xiongbiense TaxID=3051184 RepID=UPI0025530949|nr:DUF2797 domain-containing protein [Psychromicrobium sp. YIM S02556]
MGLSADAGLLVRGLSWSGESAASARADLAGLSLEPGVSWGFSVCDSRKHCLGYVTLLGAEGTSSVPCPTDSLAERGYQCGPCFARDEFRPIHDAHRGAAVSEQLNAYLARPHWLYIATFAHGVSKVGTAVDFRAWARLAEQGAVAAQYVARADDGRIVRLLEDSVSSGLGLPQVVRSTAKLAGLAAGAHTLQAVRALNAAVAQRAREHLAGVGSAGLGTGGQHSGGFLISEDPWQPAGIARPVLDTLGTPVYPLALDAGQHGLRIDGLLGSTALVRVLDGGVAGAGASAGAELDPQPWLADLGALKGRRIVLGDYRSTLPAVQTSLF